MDFDSLSLSKSTCPANRLRVKSVVLFFGASKHWTHKNDEVHIREIATFLLAEAWRLDFCNLTVLLPMIGKDP